MSDDVSNYGSYRPLSQTVSDTKRQISQGKSSRAKDTAGAVGSSLSSAGQSESDRAASDWSSIRSVSYKKGGKVRKTGRANLHRGEVVVPRGKVKRVKKAMRKISRGG
jgi:hypothetical protein